MHYEDLSLRHQTFLSEYVQNGFNASKAYADVYESKDSATAEACSSRLLSKDKVQLALAELVNTITPEYILSSIASIASQGSARNSDKLRALELLGKYHALFKDTTQNLNLHAITADDLGLLRKKLEDNKNGQKQITETKENVTFSPKDTEAIAITNVTEVNA